MSFVPMVAACVLFVALAANATTPSSPCHGKGTSLVVRTSERRLYACRGDGIQHEYKVGLGSGGLGKKVRGDAKTPLGTYSLSRPRPSQNYGQFLLIGYPTSAQRKLGYTGSSVGIHGPPRGEGWAEELDGVDWTLGCVALLTDEELEELARFVRSERVRTIHIEADPPWPEETELAGRTGRAHSQGKDAPSPSPQSTPNP